jgi:hypothetical protein
VIKYESLFYYIKINTRQTVKIPYTGISSIKKNNKKLIKYENKDNENKIYHTK